MNNANKISVTKAGYVGGILSVAFFIVCSMWGGLLGAPELKELHWNILRIAFPGFGLGVFGYVVGLVEAFVYGWAVGAFFVWLCRKICVNGDK